MLNTFSLKTSHNFDIGTREMIRRMLYSYNIDPKTHEHELFVQGNGENVEYVRLLVPKGSKLKSHANVSVTTDDSQPDYTSIDFTTNTKVLENSEIKFDYESTPANCAMKPVFLKQPGLQNYNVDFK